MSTTCALDFDFIRIFYDEKLCAVSESPEVYDFKIPFICGYGEVYVTDCDMVLGALSETYDTPYYKADADDVGEITIKVLDGNHRTFGALASGSAAYIQLSNNQLQAYQEWVALGKPPSKLYTWLDENLE